MVIIGYQWLCDMYITIDNHFFAQTIAKLLEDVN